MSAKALPEGITVHASAVLCGPRAILLRGPSGSGKSRLALELIEQPDGFARLVADDQVRLAASHGRLLAAPLPRGAGLLEVRGLGLVQLPFEPLARIGLIVDLVDRHTTERLPEASMMADAILGVLLPRLALAGGDPRGASLCRLAMRHVLAGGDLAAFGDGLDGPAAVSAG